jgi:hypothetical protein
MNVMIRTQVSLSAEQHEQLRRVASERAVSMSQLVREGVDRLLEADERRSRWQRFLTTTDRFKGSGLRDVAANHDRYLEEAYLDWRPSSARLRSTRSSTRATSSTSRR